MHLIMYHAKDTLKQKYFKLIAFFQFTWYVVDPDRFYVVLYTLWSIFILRTVHKIEAITANTIPKTSRVNIVTCISD
jgi:hypothetical protein